ncbi:Bifunctional NAD(P)H-hydrate repair enzyme Nnr [Corynebacterium occultum]|uniref:ADP-dependent (S)-NAD(P)H-hydrate dehydratase n=2 Tax=Corynebacterium occultum TaxID=2675219 RepID=A0A6B8W7L3_9CORY|nr:Bifunctional NAD(P)H-hydrate repair enzyme Nnr [Corynebacterium occultum]
MPLQFVYTVAQVRRAEKHLLEVENFPDQLMQEAARAVTAAARGMLAAPKPLTAESGRVLLLVGAGGNGGDALYAGAFLAEEGIGVDALLLGRDGRAHAPALAAFREAGGRVLPVLPLPHEYRLFIDGILGIGGRGGIAPEVAELVDDCSSQGIPILAVDVPSGINADTGALPEKVAVQARGFGDSEAQLRTQVVPSHVRADVTITFGGLRHAHAVAHDCGEVIMADLELPSEGWSASFSRALFDALIEDRGHQVQLSRAWAPEQQRFDWSTAADFEFQQVGSGTLGLATEPAAEADKYSGGVVAICAGSRDYRGAGVLSARGAVRATSSMVRYIGEGAAEVIRALPEVVAHPDISSAGKVQAWVVGPGRGTDEVAQAELAELLQRDEALLIDADALTLLARNSQLRALLRERATRQARTLLTPHAGEFRRLAESLNAENTGEALIPDPDEDRLRATHALAGELGCGVLLKGRRTVIAAGDRIQVVDAGSSWGATAGSGDVLSGILGALMAQHEAERPRVRERYPDLEAAELFSGYEEAVTGVSIHSLAAALSAQTPEGPAPTSASLIAAAIPRANARLATRRAP